MSAGARRSEEADGPLWGGSEHGMLLILLQNDSFMAACLFKVDELLQLKKPRHSQSLVAGTNFTRPWRICDTNCQKYHLFALGVLSFVAKQLNHSTILNQGLPSTLQSGFTQITEVTFPCTQPVQLITIECGTAVSCTRETCYILRRSLWWCPPAEFCEMAKSKQGQGRTFTFSQTI